MYTWDLNGNGNITLKSIDLEEVILQEPTFKMNKRVRYTTKAPDCHII